MVEKILFVAALCFTNTPKCLTGISNTQLSNLVLNTDLLDSGFLTDFEYSGYTQCYSENTTCSAMFQFDVYQIHYYMVTNNLTYYQPLYNVLGSQYCYYMEEDNALQYFNHILFYLDSDNNLHIGCNVSNLIESYYYNNEWNYLEDFSGYTNFDLSVYNYDFDEFISLNLWSVTEGYFSSISYDSKQWLITECENHNIYNSVSASHDLMCKVYFNNLHLKTSFTNIVSDSKYWRFDYSDLINGGVVVSYNGYSNGYDDGYNSGYYEGYQSGIESTSNPFVALFNSIFNLPINYFNNLANFNVFGMNLNSLFTGIITLLFVIWIIKKVF